MTNHDFEYKYLESDRQTQKIYDKAIARFNADAI